MEQQNLLNEFHLRRQLVVEKAQVLAMDLNAFALTFRQTLQLGIQIQP